MKILFLIVLNSCLFFYSCTKNDCIMEIEKPENLKPVDFENYNDVYTVYWNYIAFCDETDRSWQDREFVFNLNSLSDGPNSGDSVKVWGWITDYYLPATGQLFIRSHASGGSRSKTIFVFLPVPVANELAFKMANITFPAKCFIYGEVILPCLEEGSCCHKVTVSLYVKEIDNIYFE